jgi:hypothetical protein
MNGPSPPRDRGNRETASRWASRAARIVSRSGGLVGGTEYPAGRMTKAARVESGGWGIRGVLESGLDGVHPLVPNLLADHRNAMVLRQRTARAQQGPSGVLLPLHCGHDLLKRRTAFALEHRDHLAGLAALAGCARIGGVGGLLRPGRLVLRGSHLRRNVGPLWRKDRGGALAGSASQKRLFEKCTLIRYAMDNQSRRAPAGNTGHGAVARMAMLAAMTC